MLCQVKEFMLLPIIRHKINEKKSKIIPTDLLTAPHYALKIENRFECNREREKFSSS